MVAYVQLAPDIVGMLPRHLAVMAGRRLPPFMIPSAIFLVGELPRLANLKIDRMRLAEMDANEALRPSERGHNVTIDEVARLFESVLAVTGAAADDSFATLGGDSIKAIELAIVFERQFGFALKALERTTIREIARRVEAAANARSVSAEG